MKPSTIVLLVILIAVAGGAVWYHTPKPEWKVAKEQLNGEMLIFCIKDGYSGSREAIANRIQAAKKFSEGDDENFESQLKHQFNATENSTKEFFAVYAQKAVREYENYGKNLNVLIKNNKENKKAVEAYDSLKEYCDSMTEFHNAWLNGQMTGRDILKYIKTRERFFEEMERIKAKLTAD